MGAIARRMVGLCNERSRPFGPPSPPSQQMDLSQTGCYERRGRSRRNPAVGDGTAARIRRRMGFVGTRSAMER